MSLDLPENATWIEALDAKANMIHQQIAALQRWNEEAGGNSESLDVLCKPYYEILHSIYEEDYPLAHAIENSDLLVQFEGPAVDRTPRLSLIAGIFTSVRKRVGSVAYAISGIMDRYTLPRELDLGLSGFAKGSLYLGFSVPPPDAVSETGEKSLLGEEDPLYKATKEAIRTIGLVTRSLNHSDVREELEQQISDPRVRDTAITAIHQIAPSGRQGIDRVSIGGKGVEFGEITELTPEIRKEMKRLIEKPLSPTTDEVGTFVGIVREIDLDSRRFELRRLLHAEGAIEDIRCIYKEEYDHEALHYLDKKLRVHGKVERNREGAPSLVDAESITQVLDVS